MTRTALAVWTTVCLGAVALAAARYWWLVEYRGVGW